MLVKGLSAHGNWQMAQDFLNCGNDLLEAYARRWAADTYSLSKTSDGDTVKWGAVK